MSANHQKLMPRTVRGRVTVVLNGSLIILFLLFLAYDFHHDSADRLARKHTSLAEQARILLPGVRGEKESDGLLARLDEVRRQMAESHSESHVVAAEVNGVFLQTGMPPEETGKIASVLRSGEAPGSHVVELDGREFLVGSHRKGETIIYVAEDLVEIREAIRADMLRHLASVVVALLCGTVMINGVLWLALQRPLATLSRAVGEIGSGKLGINIEPTGTAEFDILAGAINAMSRSLAEADSARTAQMRKAFAIQASLLPARMTLAGVGIACHFEPADDVGGDYYDLLVLPDGSGLFCIADVTGHGVSAALVAGMVKICLLNAAENTSDPGKILGFVDRRLSAMNLPDMFVSMMLVRFRPGQPDLEFAGAGHPSALLVDRDGGCRELTSDGPLLGIGAGMEWDVARVRFSPGDRLVLHTDGVTEASGSQPGFFGPDRFKEIIISTCRDSAKKAVESVMRNLTEYFAGQPAKDDITLVIVDRLADTE